MPASRDSVKDLLTKISYGVPTSPAFALLGSDPEEVIHLATPADLQGTFTSWFNGTKLNTGTAVDWRPFGRVGSLAEYRNDARKQILWRSVLAAGTAPAGDDDSDVMLAGGLRVPFIDHGDPRSARHGALINELRANLAQALKHNACTPAMANGEIKPADQAACDRVVKEAEERNTAALDSFRVVNAGAFRMEGGIAAMVRANEGRVDLDSLEFGGAGVWVAVAHRGPWTGSQLVVSGKATWADPDSATQEAARYVAGLRMRSFMGKSLAIFLEAARVSSEYRDDSKDDSWTHTAIGAEISLNKAGGLFKNSWLGVAYGGDMGRSGGGENKLRIRYAVYQNRVIKE